MKVLGIDYGTKRVGLAIGNTNLKIATPFKTIDYDNYDKLIIELKKTIEDNNIELILMGLPVKLSGKEGESVKNAKALGEKIKSVIEIEVVYFDERYSTKTAQSVLIDANVSRQKRKDVIDKLAATIILQNYFDYLLFKGNK